MYIPMQQRRDTAANWTSRNSVLDDGEIGLETDTGKAKMGDGVTVWASLPYWAPAGTGGGSGTVTSVNNVSPVSGNVTLTPANIGAAPTVSPALTGTPTAPTATALTASTQVATTAYADNAVSTETTRATNAEALKAPIASPTFTGTPAAPTQTPGDNTTTIATDAFVTNAVATETTRATNAEALKAPIASPALTGTPTSPTATGGTNTTQIATTQFVTSAASAITSTIGQAGGIAGLNGSSVVPPVNLPAATPTVQGATTVSPTGGHMSPAWNARWKQAKAAGIASTGTAKVVLIGDSWTAGQATGTITDIWRYCWAGRLSNLLLQLMPSYADGTSIAAATPGNLIPAPTNPYGTSLLTGVINVDGGLGQLWGTSGGATTFTTITAQQQITTGAFPTSIDILTVDFNSTATWFYSLDGGSNVTVTPPSGSPPSGVNGTVGAGMIRRTNIALNGTSTHTIAIGQTTVSSNGLAIIGHVCYYGTTGLGFFRNGIPGWKSVDFATGGGTTFSTTGGNSLTPDHIIPWAGLNSTAVQTGAAVNNNIYASSSPSAFPFAPDLAIISLGGNDCTQGSAPEAMRKALTRFINAFRRGAPPNPANSNPYMCSILFVAEGYASEYSDNATVAVPTNAEWQRYKNIIFDLSQQYGCGYLDLQQVFGETPVTQGLMGVNAAHPTQFGGGIGGGDGHLAIANAIYGVL